LGGTYTEADIRRSAWEMIVPPTMASASERTPVIRVGRQDAQCAIDHGHAAKEDAGAARCYSRHRKVGSGVRDQQALE
jgi:hypothetical protein